MATILDGKKLNEEMKKELAEKARSFEMQPTLLIVQVGNRPESNLYIGSKKKFGEEIGVKVMHQKFDESISQKEVIEAIEKANEDTNINGIIVQLPLPDAFDKAVILNTIDPSKDVDGMTPTSLRNLFEGKVGFLPATTKGIITLLDHYKITLEGKKVVVIGRSTLVGKPTALALLNRNATVTVCHSKSIGIAEECRRADILISAVGNPKFITTDFAREGQVVIDVGINVIDDVADEALKISGDVDYEGVQKIVSHITRVPGGVGPMTIVSLFENVLAACQGQK